MVRTTMKWVAIVGLALTGCGTSDKAGDDTGGDDGVTDGGVPNNTVSIAKTGFYDDGTRWLAATSGPIVQGDVGGNATVIATFDGQPVAGVMTTAGHWSVKLPDGSLATSAKAFEVRLDGVADSAVMRSLALDVSMPAITAMPTTIRDERGDAISFLANGPAHQHAGPIVTLGGADCPAVYKYAYLTGAQAPTYGTENAVDPLAFSFAATGLGLDPQTAQYRVRDASHVILDWTPMTADAAGTYGVVLHRDGEHAVPAIGTTGGMYFVDARIHDWQDREVTASTCWDHHPLPAPVQLGTPIGATGPDALPAFTISSPLSRLITAGAPVGVFEAPLVQSTAEPVHVQLTWTQPTGSYSMTVVNDWVAPVEDVVSIPCGITCGPSGCDPEPATDARCASTVPVDPADQTLTGALPGGAWHVHVIDAATGASVTECNATGGCDLPGRAAGAPPRAMIVRAEVDQLAGLQPWSGGIGEFVLEGLPFTGLPPAESATTGRCTNKTSVATSRGNKWTCNKVRTYTRLTAYDRLALGFNPPRVTMSTALSVSTPLAPPPYLPNGATGSTLSWDGGDSDLPGPH